MDPEAEPREYDFGDDRLDAVSIKTASRIGTAWGVDVAGTAALLGLPPADLVSAIEGGPAVALTDDQRYRAGLLMVIYRALRDLFDEEAANRWPTRPNTGALFGGRTAVETMQEGGASAMAEVARYLQAVVEGY